MYHSIPLQCVCEVFRCKPSKTVPFFVEKKTKTKKQRQKVQKMQKINK